jgi:CBS domain-containing protein
MVITMLTNYTKIDPNTSVSSFLKEVNDKKNIHLILLDTEPKSYVNGKTLALKIHNPNEKISNFKTTIPKTDEIDLKKIISFFINSGEEVIETPRGIVDIYNILEYIKEEKPTCLSLTLQEIAPKEIYALESQDTIATAKNFFTTKKTELLPVIDTLKIIGEVRPIDLLSFELFAKQSNNDYFSKEKSNSLQQLHVETIMNQKPHTLTATDTVEKAIEFFLHKRLPSLIVTQEENIYSIVTIKDIFILYKKMNQEQEYNIEFLGEENLFEDEKKLIKGFALKFMEKHYKQEQFDSMKISIKLHGNKDSGHKRKGEMKISVSKGNKVIQVEKDITTEISNQEYEKKTSSEWNFPKMFQNLLKALEVRIQSEFRK